MPRRGSNTKPASSAPTIAPSVLARVSLPAVSAASPHSCRSAAPRRVKSTPDSTDVGSINRRNSENAAAVSPVVYTAPPTRGSNKAYDNSTATPAARATRGAKRCACVSRASQREAITPPAPIPRRMAANIAAKMKLVPKTNNCRKRNQMTSSASNVAPARNAAPSRRRERSLSGRVPPSRSPADTGEPVVFSPARRARNSATAAAARLSALAASAVPRWPSQPISHSSPHSAPAMPPRVFQPYNIPNPRPKLPSPRVIAFASSGNVTPIAVAGTIINENATVTRRRLTSQACARTCVKSRPRAGLKGGISTTMVRPVRPTIPSMTA